MIDSPPAIIEDIATTSPIIKATSTPSSYLITATSTVTSLANDLYQCKQTQLTVSDDSFYKAFYFRVKRLLLGL